MGEASLSRRSMMARLGAAAGAGVAYPIVNAPGARAQAAVGALGAGGLTQAFAASRSVRLSGFDFWPEEPQDGRFVSANGTYTNVAAGNVDALVRLPDGAVPRRAEWRVLNSSGASRVVIVYRVGWPFFSLIQLGAATVPSSTAGLQTIQTTFDSPTAANPNVCLLRMNTLTNNTTAVYTVELFYDDPTVVLHPVNPQTRKLDTRQPGPLTGKMTSGTTRTLALTPELPAGAGLALVNVTITESEGSGFLSLYPSGLPWPGTSTINWFGTGQTLANSATVPVAANGAITIQAGGGGRTHVVIDLLGYYR